jgi:hypothetical protein
MIAEIVSFEYYYYILYAIHLVVSFLLAIILSVYTKKRFQVDNELYQIKDNKRLEDIKDNSIIFKILFKASLHKYNRITNILFIFFLNASLPIVGYIISIWTTWYLANITYTKKVSNTNILNLDEFGTSFLKVERIFGEGSMGDLMTNEYAPKSKKLRALSSLASNLSPVNLRIIRQTLTSTDDEIRMFGYAIINKAEKALNTKINKQLELFKEAQTYLDDENNQKDRAKYLKKRAEAAKSLAPLYWEMIYTELSHESLKDNFIREVIDYITIAKHYYIPHLHDNNVDEEEAQELKELIAKLFILMGRVYISQNKLEKASTEFTIAIEIDDSVQISVLPYLAEINFAEGRYNIVNSILNSSSELSLNSTLHHVIEQWKKVA